MNVLRWVLVVPAALLGVLIGGLSTALGTLATVFLIALPNSGGWGIILTLMLIAPAIGFIVGCFVAGGGIPVAAAALMAPRHQGVVAIVVATLVIALVVIGTLRNFTEAAAAGAGTPWGLLLIGIVNVGGAIYGAVGMRDRQAIPHQAMSAGVVT